MYSKKHEKDGMVVIAACDSELLGRVMTEGDLTLDVKRGFYGGDKVSNVELEQQLKHCDIANLVGRRVIAVAARLGFVKASAVVTIGGVPHLQILVTK